MVRRLVNDAVRLLVVVQVAEDHHASGVFPPHDAAAVPLSASLHQHAINQSINQSEIF